MLWFWISGGKALPQRGRLSKRQRGLGHTRGGNSIVASRSIQRQLLESKRGVRIYGCRRRQAMIMYQAGCPFLIARLQTRACLPYYSCTLSVYLYLRSCTQAICSYDGERRHAGVHNPEVPLCVLWMVNLLRCSNPHGWSLTLWQPAAKKKKNQTFGGCCIR